MKNTESQSPIPSRILILEDDAERQRVMTECLADRFPQYGVIFFNAAPPMIEYLSRNDISELLLISLDHDLEPVVESGGDDPGTGRDVADCLAGRRPVCPVIVHTTNAPAAVGMQAALEESGWSTIRVAPYSGVRWIGETWFRAVRNAIVDSVAHRNVVPA